MSRFRTSTIARLLTCNAISQRLQGEKTSLYGLLHQESGKRGYFQKKNEIMLRDLKMHARLGYSSYAVYRLERRLAKSSRWGYGFMDMLEYILFSTGRKGGKESTRYCRTR